MNPYEQKVAVVTGGAGGLGGALCAALADRRAVVIVADLDEAGAECVALEARERRGRAEACRVDVARADELDTLVDEVVARHGRLDYMFNVAGVAVIGEVRDITSVHWRSVLDVSLMGVVNGTTSAYRVMRAQGEGHIVNVASLAGLIPFPTAAPYAAAKHAVVGLTSSLRSEAAGFGVRVTLVCPGFLETGFYDAAIVVRARREDVLRWLPFRRMTPNRAAAVTLAGVARNRRLIVFPRHARLLWALGRLHPRLLDPFLAKAVRRFRRLRTEE